MPEYIKYVSESPSKIFFSGMTKIGGGAYGNVFVAKPKRYFRFLFFVLLCFFWFTLFFSFCFYFIFYFLLFFLTTEAFAREIGIDKKQLPEKVAIKACKCRSPSDFAYIREEVQKLNFVNPAHF